MKTRWCLLLLLSGWLVVSWWVRREFFPYDVNNTDVGTFLFQAETFAHGHLWRETPEPREFFQQWQAVVRDRSYAYYPPAHALILALPLGMGLNPWLITWLLSAGSLGLLFVWSRRFLPVQGAWLAAGSLAVSPLFAFNGASLLSHSSCLFLTLFFLWMAARWRQEGKWSDALAAGVLLSAVAANRPVNAVALALVWIPWVLWARRMEWRRERLAWLVFMIGAGGGVGLLLLYYHEVSGKWALDLFTDYWPRNRYGFGKNLGRGEPGHFFQTCADHDWMGFFRNVQYSLVEMGRWWMGNDGWGLVWEKAGLENWAAIWKKVQLTPFLLVAGMLPACWLDFRRVRNQRDFSMEILPVCWLWFLAQVVLYAFYFTQSTSFSGPRYVSETMPALALATGWTLNWWWRRAGGRWMVAGFAVLWLGGVMFFQARVCLFNARGIPARRLVETAVWDGAKTPALVFVRSFWLGHPFPIFNNPPAPLKPAPGARDGVLRCEFPGKVIFACDRGAGDRRLVELYPERNAYVLCVTPPRGGVAEVELKQIYDAAERRWLLQPGEISAPFFIGGRFSLPLQLKGDGARRLFHPRPGEIEPQ
ncbi:MAG: hypothetical protein PHV34_13080 [Verrucomicrobiae bacterium]|nr:hypothetical protein [Verrucomicrobiae bacterium]